MKNITYKSTRDTNENAKLLSSAQAIKQGIAPNGGLFMPSEIVALERETVEAFASQSYDEIASHIISLYLTDYDKSDIADISKKAYSKANFPDGAAKVSKVTDKISVLELYHGPTSAFKDMALSIMPLLLKKALELTGEKREALILVATSGDTGKAALEGTKDIEGINTLVFYPKNGVSEIQKLQMETQEGGNVDVCAVEGNFDDCQTGVKNIFADPKIKAAAEKNGMFFSSANSINFGRLIPQVAYYFYGYAQMAKSGEIRFGDLIDICVPTGNFGNILAAYFAKSMGLPAGKLICASNINNVLADFFETGIYDANRQFFSTMSPSMDILISSNLERLLYLFEGAEKTSKYMSDLALAGRFIVPNEVGSRLQESFAGMFCDERNTSAAIKKVFEEYGYLIDTHTAVAFDCACRYESKNKTLVVSTASAYKFADDVYRALTGKSAGAGAARAYRLLNEFTGGKIPKALAELESKPKRFDSSVDVSGMKEYVIKKLIYVRK
ncbi:MAG: threonine synthase [Oscillospiraceae bacterium]|nr:threonine synthase [Oscillospiraceae bacterium]